MANLYRRRHRATGIFSARTIGSAFVGVNGASLLIRQATPRVFRILPCARPANSVFT
jgi:hypothetical protein